ncbi:MAG: hypothetical protein WCI11_15510 [Candidatus Methylumidiphilus sp.]
MNYSPATTRRSAFIACHPEIPLYDVDDSRYVDLTDVRGGESLVRNIALAIEWAEMPDFHQQLVTGHPGCGKSTELFRLKAELEDKRYFVIYMDVGDILDLGDITYLDILVGIAKSVVHDMNEIKLKLNDRLLEELQDWFADKTKTKTEEKKQEGDIKASVGIGGSLPFLSSLLTEITGQLKNSSSRRLEIRRTLEPELDVFIQRLNTLIDSARVQLKNESFVDLVIIVDQLEKTVYQPRKDGESNHTELFVHHAGHLKAPHCHIIYTVPISLALTANLGDIYAAGKPFVIPMVNSQSEAGHNKLREIIERRIQIEVVFDPPEGVETLVDMSGGAVRDLLRLVRLACMGEGGTITEADVDRAKRNLIMDYDRLVRRDDLPRLKQVDEQKWVDRTFADLLRQRIIHEYQNGERWADLHPAVREIPWIKRELNPPSKVQL